MNFLVEADRGDPVRGHLSGSDGKLFRGDHVSQAQRIERRNGFTFGERPGCDEEQVQPQRDGNRMKDRRESCMTNPVR